jgi:hypothetical protein
MSTSFKKMVLMPFDAIKNKRNLAKGYEKLPSAKPKNPQQPSENDIMEMSSSSSKLVHKPKKSKKHKEKLLGKWKIFN